MAGPTMTPSISVAIGRETRDYHAYLTTAPTVLDAPATLTLCEGPLSEVSWMAASPIVMDPGRAKAPARLVLVESTQKTWQRASYREGGHLFTAADPVLVGLNTLQHWLWYRLRVPLADLETTAARA